ncbi:MAG: hypothetical protein EON54_09385 [Alcaligenaceae bacterium]|nr:MAG: hypothetical protein EON54_09385 [Alcaligenaceae bacterium]
MTTSQVVLTGLIGVYGLFIALNWISFIDAMINNKGYSLAPPWLCGIIGSAAMFFYPGGALAKISWLPLMLDPSIGFLLTCLFIQKISRNKK